MIHQPQTLADHLVYNLTSADNGLFYMPMIHMATIDHTNIIRDNVVLITFVDGSELCLARTSNGKYVTPVLYNHSQELITQN
jgi:hypothetical protein